MHSVAVVDIIHRIQIDIQCTMSSIKMKVCEEQLELKELKVDSEKMGKKKLRSLRKKRSQDLRSKSVGLVGKIDVGESSQGKRIVFGDSIESISDDDDDESEMQTGKIEGDEDEDDEIEEVKGTRAKELALAQREKERKTAGEMKKLDSNRRKRKNILEESDEEDEMDDNFFDQVDIDLDAERQEKHDSKTSSRGKRTTFVSQEEKDSSIETGNNIEVVVLRANSMPIATSGCNPSENAFVYSRSRLLDGKFSLTKNRKLRKHDKTEGWRRSTKMNRIILGRSSARSTLSSFVTHK